MTLMIPHLRHTADATWRFFCFCPAVPVAA